MQGQEQPQEQKEKRVRKGVSVLVDPIRDEKAIKRIARMLKSQRSKRDYLLFILGINTGLRSIDLLRLKVKDVEGRQVGETIYIKESKTGKQNSITINKPIQKAVELYLPERTGSNVSEEPLFCHYYGTTPKPITSYLVNKLMKVWTKAANLKGNYGTHTLRKTFGYQQRIKYGTGYELICKRFNHSSPDITMRYLGIQDSEVHAILLKPIG